MGYGTLRQDDSSQNTTLASAPDPEDGSEEFEIHAQSISLLKTSVVIAGLAGVSFANSMSTGLLIASLPVMTEDLQIPDYLLICPYSIYSLTTCCCLLFAGSVADLVGPRTVNLLGSLVTSLSMLSSSLASNGTQIILFRGVQGVGVSMCLPTAVSIMTHTFHRGRCRTFGFSCLGLAVPFGFSVGLVIGGILTTASERWRLGWSICAGIVFILLLLNIWTLPSDENLNDLTWKKFKSATDWVGVLIATLCLGSLSYLCAVLNESFENIYKVQNILLLMSAILLVPAFVIRMASQAWRKRPVLIPNSLWRKKSFAGICMMVFLAWAALSGEEVFLSLFYQEIQDLSPAQASLRLLPNIIPGITIPPLVGLFVHHIRAHHLLVSTSVISTIPCFMMAVIDPTSSYWLSSFWAVFLGPVSVDVIFVIAHLIIIDAFPAQTHALAGAVFNTMTQLGPLVGLSVTAMCSHYVTANAGGDTKQGLLKGYRAAFWAAGVMMVLTCGVSLVGFGGVGKLGGAVGKEEGGVVEED
ncbi:MFS transporter [Mollisia scopiformis]|uniref:MFS transporter n=1 Tax=Mollisia scopiformis TaxID=149040 RepID=A0A194XHA7_MOLSC|nr:MFS transporter [Mollisia scopiformis]KUJ19548.1 MFS transporter [Mollisia scopiformis]